LNVVGVSSNGALIVGGADNSEGDGVSIVWDPVHGMRELSDILVNQLGLGRDIAGWNLSVSGISEDGETIVGEGINPSGERETWILRIPELLPLQAGDANRDGLFDQRDLVQVLQAARYLTGKPATWGEGDWNGAPWVTLDEPPQGDGVFDQSDIVAALNGARYIASAAQAVAADSGPAEIQPSARYDTITGEVRVDASAATHLASIAIVSAAGIFTADPAGNLGGGFDVDTDTTIFKNTFSGGFGSLSFGHVAQTGLDEEFMVNDLSVVGSLAGSGDLRNMDLLYVPEPSAVILLLVGLGVLPFAARASR
jgi:hypothetical protein